MSSKRKDFEILSQEFLILLGEKSRRADSNKKIAEELGAMDMFYEGCRAIIDQYEQEVHILKLERTEARIKAKIAEDMHVKEFKKSLLKTINEPPIPTIKEWEAIKKRRKKGASITEIVKHFSLTKTQIIELADGK